MDIKLKDFEGPLDLLLHLVSKYEVDIYDVPIVEVIEQYLAYLATLKAMKLEVAGEYMLMASQLMLIKSRKLLPTVVEAEPEADDPELELLSQLEEYARFKAASQELAKQHEVRAQYFSKPKVELVYEDVTLNQDKTIQDIFLAFSKIMAEKQEEIRRNHTTIARDDYKIEDMMLIIEEAFGSKNELHLDELFTDAKDMNQVITLFWATLELIKVHPISGLTQSLEKLQAKYEADEDTALCLLESSNTYKIVTKPDFASLLRDYSKTPINQSLSRASLEVLSIVAYKQPITRAEVDDIRGVNSSGAIAKLQAFDLIREAGKKDAVGRPNLYATTDYFLDYMGINSLDELVAIDQLELEEQETSLFREDASEDLEDLDN